jgi:integrase
MPRKVRDSSLETRTARAKLKARHKPYYRLIAPGLHIGYRKPRSGPGAWVARRYGGDGKYSVENLRTVDGLLVLADDYSDADGARVLTFAQAQQKATGSRRPKDGPHTVNDIVDAYLDVLEGEGRSPNALRDARYRIDAFVRPALGMLSVGALTTERLRRWRDDLAMTPGRLRSPRNGAQNHRPTPQGDAVRQRRVSANRTWTVLRAALNRAFRDGKIDSDIAWRRVDPFKNVNTARIRYLTVAEAQRLINACDQEFRPLVRAALLTGCRYGELARLQVRDFNLDAGNVAIHKSKSGKARHVILTAEGVDLFRDLTIGKSGDALIFTRSGGRPWGASNQAYCMKAAIKRAKITPSLGFHALRHTYASLSVMGGMSLPVLARNLGHSTTAMCELHYAHLSPSYMADSVRRHAPTFGYVSENKVATIR